MPPAQPPRYAVGAPNVGMFGDPRLLLDLAVAAEDSGWDGFFIWDHLLWHEPHGHVADPTVRPAGKVPDAASALHTRPEPAAPAPAAAAS